MNYSLHPEAEFGLREAADYYRERAGAALAQAFLADFEYATRLLVEHPLLGALWLHGKRRLILMHFPYSVIYSIVSENIRVLGVSIRRTLQWWLLLDTGDES